MAAALAVDPHRFEQDWSASFRERSVGASGNLEETIRTVAGRQNSTPSESGVARALGIRLEFTKGFLDESQRLAPALDVLRRAGLRLAVVSDCSGEVPRLWASGPLGPRVHATVFSCETGFCKPDPRSYRLALERLGLSADECAYVGDGDSRELTGAEAVGLRPFLFRFPGQSASPEYRFLPDLDWNGPQLERLEDLLER